MAKKFIRLTVYKESIIQKIRIGGRKKKKEKKACTFSRGDPAPIQTITF